MHINTIACLKLKMVPIFQIQISPHVVRLFHK